MQCPHCRVEVHPSFHILCNGIGVGFEDGYHTFWWVRGMECPSCQKAILMLDKSNVVKEINRLIYPAVNMRPLAPIEVPKFLQEDFNEAIAVLAYSPKASAALSRRCLQGLLHAQGYTQHDLSKAIDAVIASNSLPKSLSDNIDVIRGIGNFAAHPMKDTNSGEILPVEPQEAEWNLDVLEGLFDFYYVQPAKDQARRDELNAKLVAAGKQPLKQ